MTESDLEAALLFQLRAVKIPEPETQYRFLPDRRFRADFAWPDRKLLVEVDGGQHVYGRHNRAGGYAQDRERDNLAQLAGFTVLRFTGAMVESGQAVSVIEMALDGPCALAR